MTILKRYTPRGTIPTEARTKLAPYSDLLAHLLYHRGVSEPEQASKFIQPDYDRDTHDPFLLLDMEKAVERILRAIKNNEKVVIYSDYDTDGIPAGVALHDFFKKVGFKNFVNYIPHRHDEGFGLNADAIVQFASDEGGKVDLLITIDCGIADVEHVALAQSKGIDVIVTDHHLPTRVVVDGIEKEVLPPAYAVVNPKREGCAYPEKMLCGAGVVYKLIQALITRGNEQKIFEVKAGWEKWLLDMVGIATLSDMVPLTGENRVFAKYGLHVLRKSPRLGLVKLLVKLKVDQRYLLEDDIGFTIGPRINAASRMGVPMDAFRLLATDDETEADVAAEHLNAINDERKGKVAALVKEVKHLIRERYGDMHDASNSGRVVVVGNPDWRPALLGLAANTCAEEFSRPVFLWGRDGDDVIKGSCRSDGVTDLVALMRGAEEMATAVGQKVFIQYGGHAQSGGFAVLSGAVHHLEEKLNRMFERVRAGREGEEKAVELYVDAELSLDQVSWATYKVIEQLGPFGTGNPKPLFMFKNVPLGEVKHFGKEKNHLELSFEKVKAIGFFMTAKDWAEELGRELRVGEKVSLVATFEKSMFRGRPELRLRIVDIL